MKLLYDNSLEALAPYPRNDDLPVEGLDTARFRVLDLIQEAQPEFNALLQRLAPTEVIDLEALTVTRGWTIIDDPALALQAARASMASQFDALPAAARAAFYGTRAAVELALDRGDIEGARLIIEGTAVPPELAEVKANILALFPAA